MVVVREFSDLGVSGTRDLAGRPGLAELLEFCTTNGIEAVVVENATRWARDLMVGEILLEQMRAAGIAVWDASSGQDLTVPTGDPTGILIRQVLAAVAEFDRAVTVAKLQTARERIRSTGRKCEGRKAYGELPGELAIVDRIFQLRRKPRGGERLSFQAIADKLNADGIKTRRGGPWRASTVGQVLGRGRE
jgi:DNA invertase Pin-like site-specific DNA recombinase